MGHSKISRTRPNFEFFGWKKIRKFLKFFEILKKLLKKKLLKKIFFLRESRDLGVLKVAVQLAPIKFFLSWEFCRDLSVRSGGLMGGTFGGNGSH